MASPRKLPDLEILEHLFVADFRRGRLIWSNPPKHQTQKLGKEAGVINSAGYRKVTISGKQYAVHRVLWKLYYKMEPPPVLDHIDRTKLNNAIGNLRSATASENTRNTGLSVKNTSGVKGVSWHKWTRKWVVTKMVEKVDYYVGTFSTKEQAITALSKWEDSRKGA